jgi:hypothetical protein
VRPSPAVGGRHEADPRFGDRLEPKLSPDAIAGVGEGRTMAIVTGFTLPGDLEVQLMDAFVEDHITRELPPPAGRTISSGWNVPD